MTSTAELLKSSNPAHRKSGIKQLMKLENEQALKVLIKMYKTDPDPEIQVLAKKAAAVIAKKLKAAEAPAPEPEPEYEYDSDDARIVTDVEVSEADQNRARGYMDAALSLGDDREKAMKSLVKALKLDPNLQNDNFFLGVATSVLGVDNEEAIRILTSSDRQKAIAQGRQQQAVEQAAQEHLENAQKYTWDKITIDVALFALVLFLGVILMFMVYDYGADAAVAGARATLQEAANPSDPEDPPPPLSAEKRANLNAKINTMTGVGNALSLGWGALLAVGVTVAYVPTLFVFLFVTHPIASRMMGGIGTLPYMVYKAMGAHTVPLIIMYILLIIVGILVFFLNVPLGIGAMIVPGVIGLFSFIISLRMLGAIGNAYHFSFGKALITAIIANIPASIVTGVIGFGLSLVLSASIMALVESVS